ncbi:MAG: lysylphosphatidylglycerol synthase transmembrane domain-containing protein [bacterium]|nr:lysylphosphatidylglycerol synthase transmembrane domain-containing protein [bacterium]
MKQFLLSLARIAVTLLILYFIFAKIDFFGTLEVMRNSNLIFIVLAFLTNFIFTYILALRWQMVLKLYGFNVSVFRSFKIYIIGLFFGNFLPSTVGTDVIRGIYIADKDKQLSDVISSILIERWLGLLGIVTYVTIMPIIFFNRVQIKYFIPLSAGGIILSVLFFASIANDRIFGFFFSLFSKIKVLKFGEKINSLFTSLRLIKNHKRQLVINLTLSFMIQLVFVFTNYFIVLSQDLDITFIDLLIYVPFISVISMIPLTINGLGLREWAYITFFGGTAREQTVALSLSFFIITVLFSLLGGLFFLTEKKSIKEKI